MALDWNTGGGTLKAGEKMLEWAGFGPAPAGDAPVIVMLHEGLGSLGLWRDFPQRVAQATGLPVFAWSRAGYGQSDPADLPRPLDYMTQEATGPLREVLDAIGAAHFILLGHSDGATIAAEYAGRIEDFRIRGLILMAPHFFAEEEGLAEIARAGEAFKAGGLKERMARHHRDPEATFRGWNDAWLDPGFRSWNVADVIDYLRIPVLVIQGRQDQYGSLAQVREVEERCYSPVDVVLLDDCGHSPHLDCPDRILAAVADFAGRLQRIEAAQPETA
ncbi:alpha/beta fold hydrolase [Roseovarius amoyensis]|uniref:alpha/beta fold hydrolase n=1 Tax=Roseovarius amoyensis TaxID=2211448 RepID=UPI000DBE2A8A|nr:alpha/beta hydrolase [Roseovarius amoyensis]